MFSMTNYGAPEPADTDPDPDEEVVADQFDDGSYSAEEEAWDDYLADLSEGWA